ncbi:MAG TPA: hypothetical protein ENN07_05490, partial [candidate division Zixibacteria bacterium]|nr:hypothetical protein [candidate division Zixibacteria bacterium]
MRKLLAFIAIAAIIAVSTLADWPPPTELTAYSGLNARVNLTWNPAPPVYTSDTLAYDTGLTGGGGYADLDSGYYSVRFSPAGPCSLVAIQAYFFAAGGGRSARFHFWGMTDLGFPNVYSSLALPVDVNTIGTGWNNVNIAPRGIIMDGLTDFYIGVSKRDTIPELGLAYDDSVGGVVRSYRTDFVYGGHFPTPGDLLIRLVVVYLEDRSVATLAGTFGKIVTPITPFPTADDFLPHVPIPDMYRDRPMAMAPLTAYHPVSYTIYRASTWDDPLPLSYYASVPGSLNTFTDLSVHNGRTYYYSVRADFEFGVSALAETVYATPYFGTATTLYDTFFFDDGVPDAGVHFESAVLANKFHVSTRCKLMRLLVHVNVPGRGIPKVYLGDHTGPRTEILGESVSYALSEGWNSINISPYRVFVEGDFWVGVEMDGALGLSLDATTPGYAWDRLPGGVWHEIPDTTYFIRSIVQYSTDNAYYHLRPGWNAVSLPVIPSVGLRADDVFPFAVGGEIYGWD